MTMREAAARLLAFVRKQEIDEDFDEELSAHIELATQEQIEKGLTFDEARRLALIKLGGIEQSRELHRDARGLPWLDSIVQDVRYAFVTLRKNPGYAIGAIVSLGLGIGAATAQCGRRSRFESLSI